MHYIHEEDGPSRKDTLLGVDWAVCAHWLWPGIVCVCVCVCVCEGDGGRFFVPSHPIRSPQAGRARERERERVCVFARRRGMVKNRR